jgi:signal transduction histidine kinase
VPDSPLDPTISDLLTARLSFLRDARTNDLVPAAIREGWVRSREHGVDPHHVRRQPIEARRLGAAQARSQRLLDAAARSLELVDGVLASEPHMVVLSDAQGMVLRLLAPPRELSEGRESNLFEGASWHERDIGSNGIGTVIATRTAFTISGPQHFADDLLPWTCVGVPLATPDGAMAGALDVSVRYGRGSSHTAGMALAAAEQIESVLAHSWPGHAQETDVARSLTQQVETLLAEQSRLEEWDRRKDGALASLSHELRNPIGALVMLLELAERAKDDPVRLGTLAVKLRHQARRLERLVADIGDVARVKRGAVNLVTARLDLNEVARAAVEAVMPELASRRHRLQLRLSSQPMIVEGDFDRLERIFTNLLGNAAKYTLPGGDVVVETERSGGQAVVLVRDSGVGIDPSNLERIFDEFTRFAPTSLDPGGMGLGLALVRNLVRLHRGVIVARSDGPGRGSEFEVRLPLVR